MDFAAAVAIAAQVYGASRDRSGDFLVAHGVQVAQALGPAATPVAINAAILHGVPEDTDWTIDHLATLGVDPVVCEVIDVLTRRSGETYMDHVKRICDAPGVAGDTARLVKVADLNVSVDGADSDALRQRYELSLPLLQNAVAASVA